jgi:hypothetical protein
MSSADSARPSYYDTTSELARLEEYEARAGHQERVVLRHFRCRPSLPINPTDCHDSLIGLGLIDRKVPLTSIRRAITNLTKAGFLQKCEEKREGSYGRLEFCWQYVAPMTEPKQMRLI